MTHDLRPAQRPAESLMWESITDRSFSATTASYVKHIQVCISVVSWQSSWSRDYSDFPRFPVSENLGGSLTLHSWPWPLCIPFKSSETYAWYETDRQHLILRFTIHRIGTFVLTQVPVPVIDHSEPVFCRSTGTYRYRTQTQKCPARILIDGYFVSLMPCRHTWVFTPYKCSVSPEWTQIHVGIKRPLSSTHIPVPNESNFSRLLWDHLLSQISELTPYLTKMIDHMTSRVLCPYVRIK